MEGGEKSGIPLKLNPIRTRPIPAYASDEQSSSGTEDSPIWTPLGWDNGYLRFRRGKIANWFSTYFSPKSCDKPTNNDTIPPPYEASKSINLTSHKDLNRKVLKGKQICSEGEIHVPFTYIPSPLKSFSCELGPKFGVQKSSIKSKSFTDLTELLSCLDSKFVDSKEKANAELVKLMRDLKDSLAKGLLSEFQTSAQELLTISKNCINMTSYEFRNRCESIVRDLAEHKGREEAKSLLLEKYKARMLFILTRCTRLLQFGEDNWNADGESFERFKKCLESVPAVDSANNLEGSISSTDSTPTTDKARPLSLSDQKLLENLLISSPPYSLIKQKSLPIYKSHITETAICRICEENVPTSQLEAHSYVCAYANECDAEGAGVDERLIKIADMLETIVDAYGSDFDGNSFDSSFRREADSLHLIEWHNKGTEGMFEDIHELDTARIIEESYFGASCNFKSLLTMKLNGGVSFSSSPYNGSVTSASSNNNTPRASHFDLFWIGHNKPSDLENINHVHRLAYVTRKVAHVDCESETAYQDLITHLHELIEILQTNPIKGLVIDTFGCRIKKLLKKKYLRVTRGGNKRSYNQQTQNNETKTTGDSGLNSSLEEQKQVQNSISSESERISIDDFEKIKEISRGAFGKVFLAKKRTTGDLFAIKVLKKLDMICKNDIERILAERDILIAVRNPFVVRFFYSFTCRENLYLVMEYLNGGDLYSLLRTVGCLDEKNARIYIAELVLALEYLHSVGIIHRDLKPDNILIGTNGHIKLTDFGLSKIGLIANSYNLSKPSSGSTPNRFEEISESSKRIKRRSAIGTPDYLAPEILLGTEHGCAADWWSVGIILFELITGIPPFTARSPETIFDNILNRRIPWPDVPNEISYETQDLIDRLLTLDEDLRLGVNGASEVKAHPFFNEVNWDNLALQKAAFVPCPENIGDTSYFMSRYPQNSSLNLNLNVPNSNSSSNRGTATTSSSSISIPKPTKNEELEDEDVESGSYVDISSINFSFKNLAELASMNYEVLQQSGRKGYSPE